MSTYKRKTKLTKNQKALLDFLNSYQCLHIPSLKEMTLAIGVVNNNSTLRAIESLTQKGLIKKVGTKASSVVAIRPKLILKTDSTTNQGIL